MVSTSFVQSGCVAFSMPPANTPSPHAELGGNGTIASRSSRCSIDRGITRLNMTTAITGDAASSSDIVRRRRKPVWRAKPTPDDASRTSVTISVVRRRSWWGIGAAETALLCSYAVDDPVGDIAERGEAYAATVATGTERWRQGHGDWIQPPDTDFAKRWSLPHHAPWPAPCCWPTPRRPSEWQERTVRCDLPDGLAWFAAAGADTLATVLA